VDSIILYAGGKPGQAWCGWTQVFIWKKCGIKSRGGGMASSWGVSLRRVPLFKVVNGDHFTIYNKYMGRVGHVGLVYNTFPEESFFKSFEGNINSHGARESSRSFAGCLMREYGCCCGFYRWWK